MPGAVQCRHAIFGGNGERDRPINKFEQQPQRSCVVSMHECVNPTTFPVNDTDLSLALRELLRSPLIESKTTCKYNAPRRYRSWVGADMLNRACAQGGTMLKCLNCSRELVAEYDSQICAYCAGDLPCTDWHRRLSVRRFLVRLKLLPAPKSRPEPLRT